MIFKQVSLTGKRQGFFLKHGVLNTGCTRKGSLYAFVAYALPFLYTVGFSIGDYWNQVTALDKPVVWPSVSIHIFLHPSGGIFTSDLKIINALKSRKSHPPNFLCRLFTPSSGRISDFLLSFHHHGLWETLQVPCEEQEREFSPQNSSAPGAWGLKCPLTRHPHHPEVFLFPVLMES